MPRHREMKSGPQLSCQRRNELGSDMVHHVLVVRSNVARGAWHLRSGLTIKWSSMLGGHNTVWELGFIREKEMDIYHGTQRQINHIAIHESQCDWSDSSRYRERSLEKKCRILEHHVCRLIFFKQ